MRINHAVSCVCLPTDKMACRGSTLDHAEERYYAAEINEPTPEEYLTMLESWIIDQLCRNVRQQVEALLRVSRDVARERGHRGRRNEKASTSIVAIACQVIACWTDKCMRHSGGKLACHSRRSVSSGCRLQAIASSPWLGRLLLRRRAGAANKPSAKIDQPCRLKTTWHRAALTCRCPFAASDSSGESGARGACR